MSTLTPFPQQFNVTGTATHGWYLKLEPSRRLRVQVPWNRILHVSTLSSRSDLGSNMDPEEAVLARLRTAEQATRRAEAHGRIEAKRRAYPVDSLLALLELPEYRIEVSDEVLRSILESYPEDE